MSFAEVKKNFGFGCMRLPMQGEEVDLAQTKQMVDEFLAQGFNYFDTAHGYIGGRSETALRTCLTSRYPRESYVLTDKLSGGFFETEADIRPFFARQLAACGVDYFDFYLMHSQNAENFQQFKACRAYETAFELKKEGKIRHVGISFHDRAEVLERILTDFYRADSEWNVVLLRYFNPIGAHISGRIGEDPKDIPNNLLPYVAQVAIGKLECIGVFGDDYDTPDGTGVRDYIHVVDLARGHVKAIQKLADKEGVSIYNLGTGNGYSVLQVVHAFEKACGHPIKYQIKPRRPGDIAKCYCAPEKAKKELGWEAEYGIEEMCADSWRWQSNNPNGYEE